MLLTTSTWAQKTKSSEQIYAFDKEGKAVNDISKAATYDVLTQYDDTTFIVRTYNNNGPMIKQESYRDKNLTILNGRFVWYNANGHTTVPARL